VAMAYHPLCQRLGAAYKWHNSQRGSNPHLTDDSDQGHDAHGDNSK